MRPFLGLGHNRHYVSSSEMQVWPMRMCRLIAAAVADAVHETVIQMRQSASYGQSELTYVECVGCRQHLRKDDPRHDRGSQCKFPNEEPSSWTCPACVRRLPRANATHRLDHTCKWAVARTATPGQSRERRGAHPRDGRVPSAADPTAALRIAELDEAAPLDRGEPSSASGHRPVALSPGEEASPPLRIRSPAVSGNAGPRHRNAASQVTEGGLGMGGEAAGLRAVRRARDGSGLAEPAAGPLSQAPVAVDGEVDAAAEVVAAAPAAPVEWCRFDIGRALQELRSDRPGTVLRALRRLHLRWFHAPAIRMETLLQAAGVPAAVVKMSKQIVDTCTVCRSWSKPTPTTVTTSALPTRFNQLIQWDLLFIKDKIVLHTIDACTRFSMTEIVKDKETDTLLSALQQSWFKHFGPLRALVVDQEGGVTGPGAASWFEAREVELKPRAKGLHADIVERHHAILRRQFHLLDSNATTEGINASFAALIAEATFAKNVLFNMGGASPYECVYGRVPPLVTLSEHQAPEAVDDTDADRLRHLALQSMMQAMSEAKARRAEQTKTRRSGELLQLEPGDIVESWRKASTKDLEAWHGPATVADTTSLRDGQLSVRWQGRILTCRLQDVRRALIYVELMSKPILNTPMAVLQSAAESHNGVCIRLGWFRNKGAWRACESNERYARELLSGLHAAACNLSFLGVVSLRFGCGLASLPGVDCDESLLVWWKPGNLDSWNNAFLAGNQHVNFQRLCGSVGQELAFLQFFAESEELILELRQVVVDVPNVGGIHDPAMPMIKDVTAQVQQRARQRLMIEDRQDDAQAPEMFDISTPLSTEVSRSEVPRQDWSGDESFFQAFARSPPAVTLDSAPECSFVLDVKEIASELPTLSFSFTSVCLVPAYTGTLQQDELLSIFMSEQPQAVIERALNILTREEALQNADRCRTAMVKELVRWQTHDAWKRVPRHSATNALTSKWVLTWKQISGSRQVKARLVAQGFKDKQPVKNYAATTTRWGQRLVLAFSVQFDWELISADVSEAFLRGITFAELHAEGIDPILRKVQLILPPGADELIRALPGFSNYDSERECLELLKPGFGLKDAPRLWNIALQKVLAKIGLRCTCTDAQLFVKHVDGKLVLLISVHVDDLKLTGQSEHINLALKQLEQAFDSLKIERDAFEHLGLRHKRLDGGIRSVDQQSYVSELRPIPEAELRLCSPQSLASETQKQQFMSLVGGLAWVVQTRPDVAVFIAALQRRLKEPKVQDLLNANRVLKYLKAKPLEMVYKKVDAPWKLVVVSDSAFKGEDQDCLAMRSGIIGLVS